MSIAIVEVSVLFSVLTCQLLTANRPSVGHACKETALQPYLVDFRQHGNLLSLSTLSVASIRQRISYCGLWYWHKSTHPHCTHFSRVNDLYRAELGTFQHFQPPLWLVWCVLCAEGAGHYSNQKASHSHNWWVWKMVLNAEQPSTLTHCTLRSDMEKC